MADESDTVLAASVLDAVSQGWDPQPGTPEFNGLTIAELRLLDKHGRYWVDGELTDEDAQEELLAAYQAASSFLAAKQAKEHPVG